MTPWTWRYETSDGTTVDGPDLPRATFPSQADAETWIGETWRQLLEAGVEQVTLLQSSRVVYAAMSLRPLE